MPKAKGRSRNSFTPITHTFAEAVNITETIQNQVDSKNGFPSPQVSEYDYPANVIDKVIKQLGYDNINDLTELSYLMNRWDRQRTADTSKMYDTVSALTNEIMRPGSTSASLQPFVDNFRSAYTDMQIARRNQRAAGRRHNQLRQERGLTG